MSEVVELFGCSAAELDPPTWRRTVSRHQCPYLDRPCLKVRKSQPTVAIGTCTVEHGKTPRPVMICPYRFLQRRQVFADALHLLSLHEPGNELHVVPEVSLPGGSVDYFLVSVRNGKPRDFVGIELQTLDTTGTVWPARQRFLRAVGLRAELDRTAAHGSFGMNWKMTAKTTLVQLHHKVQTFEHVSRHLVLVLQDCLLEYMKSAFTFAHFSAASVGHAMHIHAYALGPEGNGMRLDLSSRCSTDAAGIAVALGLKAKARLELSTILENIEQKLTPDTLWSPV